MFENFQPSRLHGRVIKRRKVADFILTEAVHEAHSRWAPHAHENPYFCFVLQGVYTERYGRREVLCKPSTLTFRTSGQTHEDLLHDADCRIFVLELSPFWIEKLRADSIAFRCTSEFCGGTLPRLSARLNREFHKEDHAAELAIEGLALELLAEAARRPADGMRATPAWLRKAREMLVENFPQRQSLSEIAAEVGVHPVYLATAFRQKYGVTIGEFVRKLRVEHACAELSKGELPLADIALHAGFVDQSHFSKVFKSYLGTTPARYRSTIRQSYSGTKS